MHAISNYRGNRLPPTHTATNPQTGPITIHCAAKLSAQCKKVPIRKFAIAPLRCTRSNFVVTVMWPKIEVNRVNSFRLIQQANTYIRTPRPKV